MELGKDKVPNWDVCLFIEKQGLFWSVYADELKLAGKKQNMVPMWKKLMKDVDIEEPTSFLTMYIWDVLNVKCKPNETLLERYTKMFESRISAGATEKLPGWEKPRAQTVAWCFDTEGHASKNASNGIANWQTRKWSNFTKFQILAWKIINSSRKNSNLMENCQKFAHKLS